MILQLNRRLDVSVLGLELDLMSLKHETWLEIGAVGARNFYGLLAQGCILAQGMRKVPPLGGEGV